VLPHYEVRVDALIPGLLIIKRRDGSHIQLPPLGNELHGLCMAEDQLIFIHSGCAALEDECVREVLLHEMCHAAVSRSTGAGPNGNQHGKEFIAELRRLAAVGEAWAGDEAEYYETVPLVQQAEIPDSDLI
jgi:hypothetical protein